MHLNELLSQHICLFKQLTHCFEDLELAIKEVEHCLINGKKILVCGNGGSAADAQHFAAEFTGRFQLERKALNAIALTTDTSAITAIGNDYGFEKIFSRQIEGIGMKGDVLIGISTSGNSSNICKAFEVANQIGLKTISFTGETGGKLKPLSTINIAVPSTNTARIQEAHLFLEHVLCDAIEKSLHSDG